MDLIINQLSLSLLPRRLCSSCLQAHHQRLALRRIATTHRGQPYSTARAPKKPLAASQQQQQQQASPLEGYYKLLLDTPFEQQNTSLSTHSPLPPQDTHARPPIPSIAISHNPVSTPSSSSFSTSLLSANAEEEAAAAEKAQRLAQARVVFGSRLAGPAERRDEIQRRSTRIAGVLVPPRPTEPDNCCMSGCVNCVWDRYRDELEDWAAKSSEARRRRRALLLAAATRKGEELRRDTGGAAIENGPGVVGGGRGNARQLETPAAAMMGIDDDGGGSESNWGTALDEQDIGVDGDVESLFKGIPVGIREFMRTEKLLREKKHAREEEAELHGG